MNDSAAVHPQELLQARKSFPPPVVVDVRRHDAFARDPVMVAGAIRGDPHDVETWSASLEPWRRVVVYCTHGHSVG